MCVDEGRIGQWRILNHHLLPIECINWKFFVLGWERSIEIKQGKLEAIHCESVVKLGVVHALEGEEMMDVG
jgi:hypothetical protein